MALAVSAINKVPSRKTRGRASFLPQATLTGEPNGKLTRPRGYKTFFMLNSTEHEISTAHKTKIPANKKFLALSLSAAVLIMLINVKMPTIVCILTFMSRINFVLS